MSQHVTFEYSIFKEMRDKSGTSIQKGISYSIILVPYSEYESKRSWNHAQDLSLIFFDTDWLIVLLLGCRNRSRYMLTLFVFVVILGLFKAEFSTFNVSRKH